MKPSGIAVFAASLMFSSFSAFADDKEGQTTTGKAGESEEVSEPEPPVISTDEGGEVSEKKQSALGAAVDKADRAFSDARDIVEADYRKALGDALSEATEIEIYLLDPNLETPGEGKREYGWEGRLPADLFPIIPYKKTAKILSRKKLGADEVKSLLPSLRATVGVKENTGGAMCHYPAHGIRVYDGQNVVFQTSVCHQCSNFYMTYPFGGSYWTSLSSAEFSEVLQQLMPGAETKKDDSGTKGNEEPKKTVD